MRHPRKSAVVPSILAVLFAILAVLALFAIGPALEATGYYDKLDEWHRYGQYALHPRPEAPVIMVVLGAASVVCGFLCLAMTAVAILRAGRATRA